MSYRYVYVKQRPGVETAKALLLIFGTVLTPLCLGEETDKWVQINWENDIFANEDAGYTNGIGINWGHRQLSGLNNKTLPQWISTTANHTYLAKRKANHYAVSYSIGQMMFAPENIRQSTLISDDRPYAGLLFWAGSLYAFDNQKADQLTLILGIVGPTSGAKQAQKWVHKLVDAPDPKGWHHQLHNEPVFALRAERSWRLGHWYDSGLEFDIVSGLGGSAGTLSSSVNTGIALRVGSQLDSTWASLSMIPSRTINQFASDRLPNWQFYLSLAGSYVFNDVTVDGNTFRNSHSVPLIHDQIIASAGIAANFDYYGLSLSYQHGSDQFEGQPVKTRFGSLALIYRFH